MSDKTKTQKKGPKKIVLKFQLKIFNAKDYLGNMCSKDNTNNSTLMYVLCCNFNTNIKLIGICQIKRGLHIFALPFKLNLFFNIFFFFSSS